MLEPIKITNVTATINYKDYDYYVQYGTTVSMDNVTAVAKAGEPIEITDLTPGTGYYYKIVTEKENTPVLNFTTKDVPVVNTDFAIAGVDTALVTGAIATNAPMANFQFEYSTMSEVYTHGTQPVDILAPGGKAITTLTNLLPNTKYYYRIISSNIYGIAIPGAQLTFTT